MNRDSSSFPSLLLGLFFFCYFISGFYYLYVFSKPASVFPDESIVFEKKNTHTASSSPLITYVADASLGEKEIIVGVAPTVSYSKSQPTESQSVPTPASEALPSLPSVSAQTVRSGGVTYSSSTIYYDIYGLTENELRAEMNAKGPLYSDGKRYDAFTSRYYTWNYFSTWNGKNCYSDEIYVTVGIKITLPQWMWYASAQEPLKSKWTHYIDILTLHENGHVAINAQGAEDLYQRLINAGPYSSCPLLDAALHGITSTFYNDIKLKNEAYDAETSHGKTQGAVFP